MAVRKLAGYLQIHLEDFYQCHFLWRAKFKDSSCIFWIIIFSQHLMPEITRN